MNVDTPAYNKRARIGNILVIIVLFVVFTIYYRNTHTEAVTYNFQDTCVVLTGAPGSPDPVIIKFSDIVSISQTSSPNLGGFVDGCNTKLCQFGIWENEAYGSYTLCAYPDVMEYIVIETTNGYVVCNYENNDATDSLYEAMLDYLKALGYQI